MRSTLHLTGFMALKLKMVRGMEWLGSSYRRFAKSFVTFFVLFTVNDRVGSWQIPEKTAQERERERESFILLICWILNVILSLLLSTHDNYLNMVIDITMLSL